MSIPDASFHARRLAELFDIMLTDMAWIDEWTPSRIRLFEAKYGGVMNAVSPPLNATSLCRSSVEVRDGYMRAVETSLRTSREQVVWMIASFFPHHVAREGDDLFWRTLLT